MRLDDVKWGEFKLGELFYKIKTEKIVGKANDFPTSKMDDDYIPLLTAGIENQGLSRFAHKNQCPTVLQNVISISANGANTGVTFYQDGEFAVLQDAYAINLIDNDIPNKQVGLFLAAEINKILHGNFGWSLKAGWERIKGLSISLPVDNSGEPDWQFMEDYISELEQERISELEQYLIVTGLNDYELTEEEKKILATKLTDGEALQNSISGNDCTKEARMFRVGDLFKKEKLGWIANRKFNKEKDISKKQTKEFNIPLVNAKDGNNGIMYYGRKSDFSYVYDGIDIVNDGAISTGNVYPQPHDIGVLYNAYIITLKNKEHNRLLDEYLSSSLEKAIKKKFNYSNKAGWEKVKDCEFILPIQTDSNNNPIIDPTHKYHPQGYIPDWQFMEDYIRAIEKVVVKDVVKYKDDVISKTKEVIA